jgi:hypothetical protein
MKCSIFWNTTASALLKASRHFGSICRIVEKVHATWLRWFIAWLFLQPKTEEIRCSELQTCFKYATRRHIQGDRRLNVYDKMKGIAIVLNEKPHVRIGHYMRPSVRLIKCNYHNTGPSLLFKTRFEDSILSSTVSYSGWMFICSGAKVFIAPLPNKGRLLFHYYGFQLSCHKINGRYPTYFMYLHFLVHLS